jgi:Family of unknown function (DUF5761)
MDLTEEKDLRGLPLTSEGMRFEGQNGRVTFGPSFDSAGLFQTPPGFKHQTEVEDNYVNDMLRGNWEQNTLSQTFFSPKNIRILQNSIRKEVFDRSGEKKYVIDDQSVDELKMIMRGIYYQYARNLDTNIAEQVKDLNDKVVDWSAPHILSAVDHYHYYINDISHMPVPMQQPQNISRAGTRSLPANPYM